MHGTLVEERAGALEGCRAGPDEETELKRIGSAMADEAKRWPPLGKERGGKG